MFVCFLFILVDVIFSLIFFQTKKTLFVVIACVMAIPFAKNLIGYLMIIKYQPLDEEMNRLLAVRHCAEIAMMDERKRTHEEALQIQP